MSVTVWLILGLIAGFIASRIDDRHGEAAFLDIVLGIVGAAAGGSVFWFVHAAPASGFDAQSAVVALIGSVAALAGYHAVSNRHGV